MIYMQFSMNNNRHGSSTSSKGSAINNLHDDDSISASSQISQRIKSDLIRAQNQRLLQQGSPELEEEEDPKTFLFCMSLLTGVRCLAAFNTFCFILLLILCITKRDFKEAVVTQLCYAFLVFLPGSVAAVIMEFRGTNVRLNR